MLVIYVSIIIHHFKTQAAIMKLRNLSLLVFLLRDLNHMFLQSNSSRQQLWFVDAIKITEIQLHVNPLLFHSGSLMLAKQPSLPSSHYHPQEECRDSGRVRVTSASFPFLWCPSNSKMVINGNPPSLFSKRDNPVCLRWHLLITQAKKKHMTPK